MVQAFDYMFCSVKRLIRREEGLGTVEMVIILAVLVGIALIFRKSLFGFAADIIDKIFSNSEVDAVRSNPVGTPGKN